MPRGRARVIPARRSNQAAVLALHRQELGQGRLQAQIVGIGGIDARDQGLNQPIQGLSAQPPAYE